MAQSTCNINWLLFNPVNAKSSVYPIPISGLSLDTLVHELEWIAILKRLFNFQTHESTIEFWQPDPPLPVNSVGGDWIKSVRDIEGVARFCQPVSSVGELADGPGNSNNIHLIVTAEELVEDGDTVPEPPLQVMHRRFCEGRASLLVSPSPTANSQASHSTVVTIAPPVQIFHPVFQEFLDRVDDPAFEPDEEAIFIVSKILPATMVIYPSGHNALAGLLPLFSKLLGGYVGPVSSTWGCTVGAMRYKQLGECTVPLVSIEYKHAFGEGGHDPSIQASYSVREFLVLNTPEPILEKCSCPSFILAGGGPYLSILGVVYTDKFIVQRLTDIKWVGEATTHEESHVYHLARVFTSLRFAVAALDEYYGRVWEDPNIPVCASPKPHPRFFPYPTRFDEYPTEAGARSKCIEFEYIDTFCTDPTNVTFLARVKSSDRKLVVKFVGRYGTKAHQLLADAGMAPQLLYCGSLDGKTDVRDAESRALGSIKLCGLYDGPMRMVVMENIEGNTADKEPTWPNDARERIEKATRKLHDAELVFGDLRAPNVMFSGKKVFLIDFDWAGKVNEARYPRNLSSVVKWPGKAVELEMKPILKDHDLFMLDQLFAEFLPSRITGINNVLGQPRDHLTQTRLDKSQKMTERHKW